MCQTVQQSRCHPFALKNLPPFAEGQVARDQQAPPLVTFGEHLEEQLGAGATERQIAQYGAIALVEVAGQHNKRHLFTVHRVDEIL